MKRFGVLFKKEFIYGSIMMKVMMYTLTVGYGLLFGFLSRLSDYMFSSILELMPLVIAMSGAPQVLQSLSSDKQERTGEMVLTTGISLPMYILPKLLACMLHTIMAVLFFFCLFLTAANRAGTMCLMLDHVLYAIFMSMVISIFYCCTAIMFRLTKVVHKLIIAAFLLIVVSLVALAIINSFVVFTVLSVVSKIVLWFVLFLYGVICMCIGMKLLAVRDFVAK